MPGHLRNSKTGEFFIFLEFHDPEILCFLAWLRKILSGKEVNQKIHLTVRGPYKKAPSPDQIESWLTELEKEPVLLANAGMFNNNDDYVVFLKVENSKLRSIWYKPDFPSKEYGFNPHVTLYKGKDKERAHKCISFLRKEKLALLSHNYSLECYKSKEIDLFKDSYCDSAYGFQKLVDLRLLKHDILERAMLAIHDFKFKNNIPIHFDPYA